MFDRGRGYRISVLGRIWCLDLGDIYLTVE